MNEPFFHVLRGEGEAAFVEQKSRFIGRARPVQDEAAAVSFLEEVKRAEWDARHNCFAYILREPPVVRQSDNGEPQGTAGLPILNCLQHNDLFDVCCVVTRYFGGVLLGTGGLTRAYGRAAREAVAAAGITCIGRWRLVLLTGHYRFFDSLTRLAESCDAVVEGTDYADEISMHIWVRAERCGEFCEQVVQLTAGDIQPRIEREENRAI